MKDEKTVILSGFSRDELFAIVRLIRKEMDPERKVAFGSLTEHNRDWTLSDLIEELHKEHKEVQNLEKK